LVCDVLPVCLFKNAQEEPLCLLFSIAAHPSILRDFAISAEFPGVACNLLDEYLGATASLFLQGTGGDSKPRNIIEGTEWKWQAGWEDAETTGRVLAHETRQCLEAGLIQVEPQVSTALLEMHWPLQAPLDKAGYEAIVAEPDGGEVRLKWATRQIEKLEKYGALPASVPVFLQGVQLGKGLRLVAMEGEPMAHYGHMMLNAYPEGVTFPLGYVNGEALYLVTSNMLDEGGMEPESYWEFGFPAPLAKGMEPIVAQALADLWQHGAH